MVTETERIKKIVEDKINYIIWKREQMYKRKGEFVKRNRQLIPVFERLKEDIIFLIDNPNHTKKPKEDKIATNPAEEYFNKNK